MYMTQREAVATLQQAKIEPTFSTLVWQKLEEQNHQFFRCARRGAAPRSAAWRHAPSRGGGHQQPHAEPAAARPGGAAGFTTLACG